MKQVCAIVRFCKAEGSWGGSQLPPAQSEKFIEQHNFSHTVSECVSCIVSFSVAVFK